MQHLTWNVPLKDEISYIINYRIMANFHEIRVK